MTLVFKDVCRNFHFFLCLVLFLPQHTAQSKNMVNMLSYQGWNFNVSLRKLKVSPWKLQHFMSYTRWQIECQLFERKNCHIFLPQYCARKDIPCGLSMISLMETKCGKFLAKKTKLELAMLSQTWSVLDFWKINLEKSSLTNWIFSLFQTEFLLPV